jgi:hypothetical protein
MNNPFQVQLRTEMLNRVYTKPVMEEIANDIINIIDKSRIVYINDLSKQIAISVKQRDSDLINLYPIVANELRHITDKYKDQLTPIARSTFEEMSDNDFFTFFNATISESSTTKKLLTIYL